MNFDSKLSSKLFKEFIKDEQKPSKVKNLMKPPPKEKGKMMPKLRVYSPHTTHQADVLYLPDDKGFKYALVVVDVNTRKADAEPMKKHSADEVVKAIQKFINEVL